MNISECIINHCLESLLFCFSIMYYTSAAHSAIWIGRAVCALFFELPLRGAFSKLLQSVEISFGASNIMADVEAILKGALSRYFWLCDGTLKYIAESRKPSWYFGSAAVNAHWTMKSIVKSGSVGLQNLFCFTIQDAELMSILCASEAAMRMPRTHVIIVTDDHSRDQHVLQQVVKTWSTQEMSWPMNRFRLPVVAYIRMNFFHLLTDLQVQSIILTDFKTLQYWRSELAVKRKKWPTSRGDEEWEPHWICARARDTCARTLLEDNMFGGSGAEIWDFTFILPDEPGTVTNCLVVEHFLLPRCGRGYKITLR